MPLDSLMKLIESHYKANRRKLVLRLSFRAGTEWDAEDIVQETYARAIKYIHTFDNSNFDRWLGHILNNCLRDFKRNEKGFSTNTFEEDEVDGIPCNQYNERVVEEINDLIATKSIAQIEVLSLYFKQGYSATDISEITTYTYAAIHQMILRFRNELKELYK